MNISPEAAEVRAAWREQIIDQLGPLTVTRLHKILEAIDTLWPNGGISANTAAEILKTTYLS